MPIPSDTRRRVLDRLDDLIRRGEAFKVEEGWKTPRPRFQTRFPLPGESGPEPYRTVSMDWPAVDEWRTACVLFLERIVPKRPSLQDIVTTMHKTGLGTDLWQFIKTRLRAIREEINQGLLDELSDEIEAEIAADYMGQAEQLLGDGHAATKAFIPAAVLAGAVLERYLRALCAEQSPPVDPMTPNGKPKTLDPLISDLAKAGAVNGTRATLLRGWAAIRNRAAHGEWDQFTREDVEGMVRGVRQVVAGL